MLKNIVLLEGIQHIEDLPTQEFIKTIESLGDKIITEKLDGGNLWFGLDETGVFTSREGKSPKKGRFYKVDDIATVANYNAFRSAHKAIEAISADIKKHFQIGDSAEIEILYGRQPNTVTYGVADKSFIVILRGVNGTPDERVKALSAAINKKQVTVESSVVSSDDGDEIKVADEKMVWEFTKVQPVDSKKIDTKEAMKRLAAMKVFLATPNKAMSGKNNGEVADLSLTSVPKDERDIAKAERVKVTQYILDEFKNPIKELLLNKFVRKIKPFLQSKDLHPSEDIGVEGVVVMDPVTGSMTKIVDKDVFTAINTFNSGTRNSVSGLVRTVDQDAALEMRGGVFGQAKIRIAELLGAKELAMSSGTKRFVSKFKGDDVVNTAKAIGDSLNITSLASTRTKISAILKNSITEVNEILDGFKKKAGGYKLELKDGKEIGLTPEVMKRTLTAFAETKKDIKDINSKVLSSRNPGDLVMALYGKTIESLFDGDTPVKESFKFIKSIAEDDAAGVAVATTANMIATQPGRLGPKIEPRRRLPGAGKKKHFEKSKEQFSLLKSVQEDWAHVNDMKFAADVDDSTAAKNDVEFSNLRNNVAIGQDVTTMDVNRYLDKAHEINDEVDAVTFGLEMDDGSIAKVYVNAQHADNFEQALADLLGKEDDVEEVINQLADKFDIVDVEWPKDNNPAEESDSDPASDFGFDAEFGEPPDINTDIEDGHDDESTDDEPIEDEPVDDESTEDEPVDDEPVDDESTEDEFEEPELDDQGNPLARRKKKPTKKEESMSTLGQKFTNALLEAKAKPVEKEEEHPSPLDLALKKFIRREEKAIVKTMIALGLPLDLVLRKALVVKDAIQNSTDMYIKDSAIRLAVKRFLAATSVTESVAQMNKQLTSVSQRIALDILEALGLNDEISNAGKRQFTMGVREAAVKIAQSPSMHTPFLYLAKALGVDVTGHPAEESLKEEVALAEDAAAIPGFAEVKQLLALLGIDANSNLALSRQLDLQAVKTKIKMKMRSQTALTLMTRLIDSLNKKESGSAQNASAPMQKVGAPAQNSKAPN